MSASAQPALSSAPFSVVWLNGELLPAAQAAVSIFDRGFTYGDAIFEAIRIVQGKPFAWDLHMARWAMTAEFLRLSPPSEPDLANAAAQLISANSAHDAVLRLQLSRGVGARGYSSKGAANPTCLATLHPLPDSRANLRVITSSYLLPPLSQFKTCSRLVNVLARDEAEAKGAGDALFLNSRGHIAEATAANIFWFEGQTLCTPALSTGCLPGVTRQLLLELWGRSPKSEIEAPPERLIASDGAFLTNSAAGLVEITSIDGKQLPGSCAAPDLQEAYALRLQAC